MHLVFVDGEDEVQDFFEIEIAEFFYALEMKDAGCVGEEAKGRMVFSHPLVEQRFDLRFFEGAVSARWKCDGFHKVGVKGEEIVRELLDEGVASEAFSAQALIGAQSLDLRLSPLKR